ncbi:MAG: hypothetical protein RDU20_14130 [Desulfomonilaceae bacterium]|nr:hypothetical protein [Desulfomonilaceae bacterium]
MEKMQMPRAQIWYGEVVYWLCIVSAMICAVGPVISLASPEDNVLNPFALFGAIWQGKTAAEVWQIAGGGFPGGHFYLTNLFVGDGITQAGIALGCMCALPALLVAAVFYIREKRRAWFWAVLSVWVAFMIGFSMIVGGPPSH